MQPRHRKLGARAVPGARRRLLVREQEGRANQGLAEPWRRAEVQLPSGAKKPRWRRLHESPGDRRRDQSLHGERLPGSGGRGPRDKQGPGQQVPGDEGARLRARDLRQVRTLRADPVRGRDLLVRRRGRKSARGIRAFHQGDQYLPWVQPLRVAELELDRVDD